MAIGTPVLVGSGTGASGGSSTTFHPSQALSTPGVLVILVTSGNATAQPTAPSDTKSNSYSLIGGPTEDGTGGSGGVDSSFAFGSKLTTSLTTSDTVTVNFSSGNTEFLWLAIWVPGADITQDGSFAKNGSSAGSKSLVCGSVTLANSGSIVVAFAAGWSGGVSATWSNSFTGLTSVVVGSSPNADLFVAAYRLPGATGAQTTTATDAASAGSGWETGIFALVPASSGNHPTVTASDTLTSTSETLTRQLSLVRSLTDTLTAITETLARHVTLPRAVSDTLTAITESATRTLSLVRSPSDTLQAISDSAQKAAQAFTRARTDTVATIADTATEKVTLPRGVTDALAAITDSGVGLKVIIRTASDTLAAISESNSRVLTLLRSPNETITAISEALARVVTEHRSSSDSAQALSDNVLRTVAVARAIIESLVVVTDSASRALALGRSASENVSSVSDSVGRAAQALLRGLTDTLIGIGDTISTIVSGHPVFFAYGAIASTSGIGSISSMAAVAVITSTSGIGAISSTSGIGAISSTSGIGTIGSG